MDPVNQGNNPQNHVEEPVDAIEKMRRAGIDPNAIVNLMVPVIFSKDGTLTQTF